MTQSKYFTVFIGLLSGLFFGAGMVISGMVDPIKVIGFLNVTGHWDPSLAFVMGGALLVFTPFYHLVIKKREHAINGDKFTWTTNTVIDGTLISGATLFGIGWGLVGFCPGPVITSIGSGSYIILAFITFMLIGIVYANQYLAGRFPLPVVGYRKNVCAITRAEVHH